MSTHIRPEDVTADSNPDEVAESMAEDFREGNVEEALELNEAAAIEGVGRPSDEAIEDVEAAEDEAMESLLGDDTV